MDREIDAAALEAAMAAYHNHWERASGAPETIARECMTAAITAYLAAHPTPDAEAMERFVESLTVAIGTAMAVGAMTVEPKDQKRINQAKDELRKREQALLDLFRKAVSR